MKDPRIMLSPGPVHVASAIGSDIEPLHHRSAEFRAILAETEEMMRELLGTSAPVYAVTSSGTGGMEFAVASCARAGSRVLAVSGGKFGDRWAELCRAYGCEVAHLRFPEGKAVDIGAVSEKIASLRPDLLTLTHVESSTGLLLDPEALARSIRPPRPLILLDAIASLGVERLEMDSFGIDAVVAASQKAFGAPPGMSFVAMGERAREAAGRGEKRGFYFSVERYEEARVAGDTPFTPAVQIVQIVHRALVQLKNIGFERVRERHRLSSRSWVAACARLGLKSFPQAPSDAVQVLYIPNGYNLEDLADRLMRKGEIIVAGGQDRLAGMVIRTGFLGLHGGEALGRAVSVLATVLEEAGCPVDREGAEREIGLISDQGELFL